MADDAPRALGRDPRARRRAVRARRARHAAARGLLPAARQRHRARRSDAISAGLGWVCALDKDFTGAERLREIKERGPERKLVAFRMTEQAIPRQGMAIEGGGEVTSGSLSPMLDVGIGMGYVPAAMSAPGTRADDRRARPPRARPRS